MMAVKDYQYQYFPSQERLVNVSNYMINPHNASSSPDGWLGRHASRQRGGYNISDSSRYGRDQTIPVGVEVNPDFEMKNVRWSEEKSAVSDLLLLRFPVIVKVVKGYYGNDEQQLIDGQILQVYMSCEELRVTATDNRDRTLTLPINCPLSVRLHSGPHSSEHPQELSDLLKDVSFPARIEVIAVKQKDKTSNKQLSSNISDSQLTLKEISRQKFLVANAIRNGWLDQSRFVIIPEQLKLTFRMATGIRHVTNEEWKDICGMYSRAARHLKFHLISGYNDVIYDDWINQSKPPTNQRRSPGIDSDADEDEAAEDESDSDSAAQRTRSRLLRQQAPLSQGSLPSLPTALRDCTLGSDPGHESRASVGSITPSHLSTESMQASKSTESLLPRGSVDSVAVVKETVSKRKSNMPPRLLRRKAEPRKQDSVLATEFELKSNVMKTRISPRTSELVPQSTAPVTGRVSISQSSADDDNTYLVDDTREFVFGEPSWKDRLTSSTKSSNDRLVSQSPSRRQGNPNNVSSNDVSSTPLDGVKKKWRKNDSSSNLHGSSDGTLLDVQCVDSHVWSPVYWSSDLCIGASVSSSGSQIARMKRTKAQKRSDILSRDLCAYPNATVDRPLSLNSRSTPLHSTSTIHSFGLVDSTQSLFSSPSTELSSTHRVLPGTDRIHHGQQCSSSGTYNDAVHFRQPFPDIRHMTDSNAGLCTPHGSTGCIATRHDYSNPIKLGVNRSRKLSNGLVRMKLDQNGTVLSSGSEVIDDGYSTKGNSMTSSVETLQARRSVNTCLESLC